MSFLEFRFLTIQHTPSEDGLHSSYPLRQSRFKISKISRHIHPQIIGTEALKFPGPFLVKDPCALRVPIAQMVKSDRTLKQSLEKPPFRAGSLHPDLFHHIVALVVLTPVEEVEIDPDGEEFFLRLGKGWIQKGVVMF